MLLLICKLTTSEKKTKRNKYKSFITVNCEPTNSYDKLLRKVETSK